MTHPPAYGALPVWNFQGDCVVISGAARGIGAEIVRHFARSGAEVIFGDVDTIGARQLCGELAAEGRMVHFVEADFTQADAWIKLRDKTQSLGLSPSLVVANVGVGRDKLLEEETLESFDRIFNANLRSGWLAARDFGPLLRQRAGASLVLVGSVMASFGYSGGGFYATSKAALSGLLRSLCVELSPAGVRVNMIVPGYIMNDPPGFFRAELSPELWREFHERFGRDAALANPPEQPLAFWGEPRDIAQAVSFLHSPAARYITGIELRVDGGLLCQTVIREESGNGAWSWTEPMRQWLRERGVEPAILTKEPT